METYDTSFLLDAKNKIKIQKILILAKICLIRDQFYAKILPKC